MNSGGEVQGPRLGNAACDARWGLYCAAYAASGLGVLAWFVRPSLEGALAVLALVGAGYASALDRRAGLAWAAAMLAAVLASTIPGWSCCTILWWRVYVAAALVGAALVWMLSRRVAAGVLVAVSSPALIAMGQPLAAALVVLAAAFSIAIDSGRLHVAPAAAVAVVVAMADPQWAALGAAILVGSATTAVGALGEKGCPFRSENLLVGTGILLAGAALIAHIAGVDAMWASARQYLEAIEALGLILLLSGLLAPRPTGELLLRYKGA